MDPQVETIPTGDAEAHQTGRIALRVRMVDTAGLRPSAELHYENERVEHAVHQHTIAAVNRAHIVAVMIDVADLVTQRQGMAGGNSDAEICLARAERKIIKLAQREGKGVILIFNKVDALPSQLRDSPAKLRARLRTALPEWISGGGTRHDDKTSVAGCENRVPLVVVSALEGRNVHAVRAEFIRLYDRWNSYLDRGKLNRWFTQLQILHPAPCAVRYLRQIGTRPPSFALFVGRRAVSKEYLAFFSKALQAEFGLGGIPIRVVQRLGNRQYR